MKTFNNFTTVKLQQLNDLIYYKNSEQRRIRVQLNKGSNLKIHLTKIQCPILSKSVTKC